MKRARGNLDMAKFYENNTKNVGKATETVANNKKCNTNEIKTRADNMRSRCLLHVIHSYVFNSRTHQMKMTIARMKCPLTFDNCILLIIVKCPVLDTTSPFIPLITPESFGVLSTS